MRTLCVLGAMGLVVGLGGCMIVDAPIRGVMGTEVIWGDMATSMFGEPAVGSMKHGKGCAESVLGRVARGDAGIVGEWCTLVRGYSSLHVSSGCNRV